MLNYIKMKLHAVYSAYCDFRLNSNRSLASAIKDYKKVSESTGAKPTTLYEVYKGIIRNKPQNILECGTGLSTVVIAEAILFVQKTNPEYKPSFTSMENNKYYHSHACEILPRKYRSMVDIVWGERIAHSFAMFRGFIYKNKPELPFDFIFVDGPNYDDEYGSSYCADVIDVLEKYPHCKVSGVIDTRVSTCFVMQALCGRQAVKYSTISRVGKFTINNRPPMKFRSLDFSNFPAGQLRIK